MRKYVKILVLVLATAFITVAAAGCGSNKGSGNAGDGGEKYTIKLGHVMDTNHHYQKGAEKFKELVEQKTNGRVQVQIYPNSQLGAERAMLEGMQLGTIEMGIITSGALSNFVPEFAVLDLGYLFKDSKQAQEVLNGPVGQELSEKMAQVGIRNLGFLDAGFRSVYAKKPVRTPDDLKGMKIRTMENPAHIALFKALGANPIPMNYSELYTALQQGTVDGAENVVDVFYKSKHYEVAPVFSETNHVYLVVMYMISEKFFQGLPPDIQQAIQEAAREAIQYENSVFVEHRNEAYNKLKEAGVTVVQIDDVTAFQQKAKQSWREVVKNIPNGQDLLDKIMKATGQTW